LLLVPRGVGCRHGLSRKCPKDTTIHDEAPTYYGFDVLFHDRNGIGIRTKLASSPAQGDKAWFKAKDVD
jgi:hypothetical protein